jgi:transposase
MARKRTPDIKLLQELYEKEGLSLREIAERFGVSHQAIHNRLERVDTKFRHTKQIRKTLNEKVLRRLYSEEGLNKAELARKFGVSNNLISSELKRLGIPTLKAFDRAKKRIPREVLIDLYVNGGLTQEQISKQLDVEINTLLKLLRHYEIDFRRRRIKKTS